MTIGKILSLTIKELETCGILTADLDVRLMLEDILNKDSSYFFSHPEAPISNPAYQKFRRLIKRRKKGEPVAYLLGWKEFYGLRFKVNKNVLIPRPETEAIVDETIAYLKSQNSNLKNSSLNVLDIGTGSGAIIITLAKTLKYNNIRYFALDVSEKALKIAKLNAMSNNVDDQISFYKSDLLTNPRIPKNIDIILANLPYIPFCHSEQSEESHHQQNKYHKKLSPDPSLPQDDKRLSFEPQNALFADKKGLDLIEKLIIQISERSYKPKLIILEIFEDHPEPIRKLVEQYLPKYRFEVKKDYAGLNRLIILTI